MRNTLQEEKLKDKFEGDDKDKIEKAVQEALDWLDKNQLAEKDEFEAKQKELEGVVNPIMMKVYQAAVVVVCQKAECQVAASAAVLHQELVAQPLRRWIKLVVSSNTLKRLTLYGLRSVFFFCPLGALALFCMA